EGSGRVPVVDHTGDNNIVTFRFRNRDVKMLAAEEDFELGGHTFRAGSIIVPDADRAAFEPILKDLGLSAWAVASAPSVKVHDLDIPRIGYIHSWTRTQDEGWWRAALDTFGVPYTYFADQKLKEGNLRSKYDVLIFPHVGGTAQSQVNGMPITGSAPLPYKKTAEFPNLAFVDSSDDIRGGMGVEGLAELAKFVREGGTLITDGSTSTIFPEYGIATGVTVDPAPQLFARGTILRARFTDLRSPIAYGAAPSQGGGRGARGGAPAAAAGADEAAQQRQLAQQFGIAVDETRPRVVLQFSPNADDLLLSGTLGGGQALASTAAALDHPLGKGHVVMFAIRPFWRWQTQGTYTLGFNAIMNWNDLDAGRAAPAGRATTSQQQ